MISHQKNASKFLEHIQFEKLPSIINFKTQIINNVNSRKHVDSEKIRAPDGIQVICIFLRFSFFVIYQVSYILWQVHEHQL